MEDKWFVVFPPIRCAASAPQSAEFLRQEGTNQIELLIRKGSSMIKLGPLEFFHHHGLQTALEDSVDSPEELTTLTGLCGGV